MSLGWVPGADPPAIFGDPWAAGWLQRAGLCQLGAPRKALLPRHLLGRGLEQREGGKLQEGWSGEPLDMGRRTPLYVRVTSPGRCDVAPLHRERLSLISLLISSSNKQSPNARYVCARHWDAVVNGTDQDPDFMKFVVW